MRGTDDARLSRMNRQAIPTWSEALSVGDRQIDAEHRCFLARLEDLAGRLDAGVPADIRKVVATVVAELADHFRHEEAIFVASDYPDATPHAVEHGILLHMAQDISREISASDNISYIRLSLEHMAQLVVDHLMASDLLYRPYLHAAGA